jgi:two-component system response regulator YesN
VASVNKEASYNVLQECLTMWERGTFDKSEIMTQAQSLLTIVWTRSVRLGAEEMMQNILDKQNDIRQIATLEDLNKFVCGEFQRIWETSDFPIVALDSGSAHAIQLALPYIHENYRGPLSLSDVADHVHMSKNYFSEQFKRLTGLNFIDFLIRLRIHYAKQLLVTTSLKIYDIGIQSGFNSSKHFLKLFKRMEGCTPVEYRQRHTISGDGRHIV